MINQVANVEAFNFDLDDVHCKQLLLSDPPQKPLRKCHNILAFAFCIMLESKTYFLTRELAHVGEQIANYSPAVCVNQQ